MPQNRKPRPKPNPDGTMSEAQKKHLKENYDRPNKRQEASELPGWVKVAMTYVELYGLTRREAAEAVSRSYDSFCKYMKSPAAKEWRELTREKLDDPGFIAETLLRATTLGASLDYVWAMDRARELGDYKEVRL
ncbi:MAG: hypothetical protein ACWGQW_24630, partial [bacterium]